MKHGIWIIASSFIQAFHYVMNRKYGYKGLICDVNSIQPNAIDKDFLVMRQKQYFERYDGCFESLISKDLIGRILAIYDINKQKRHQIYKNTRTFNLDDYESKYKEYQCSKEVDYVYSKIEKFEIQPYVGIITTHEDVLASRAKKLTANSTDAEKCMARLLNTIGVEYYFQYPCNNGRDIIMDFYIPSRRICIEIDGGYHNNVEMLMKDKWRDQDCAQKGILVLRYTNDRVLAPTKSMIEGLCALLDIPVPKIMIGKFHSDKETIQKWLEHKNVPKTLISGLVKYYSQNPIYIDI